MRNFRGELDSRSGFAELLFAEEGEEADADDELHDKGDPEPSFAESVSDPATEVGEDIPRADGIWSGCPRDHGRNGTQNLRCNERERNMDSGQCLKQNHSEADSL